MGVLESSRRFNQEQLSRIQYAAESIFNDIMSKKAILFLALSLCLLITACASNQITSATTDISVESMEPSIKETLETLETYESKEELSESVFPYITITIPVTEGQRLTIGESTENFWSYERKAGYVDELASPTYVFTWNNQYLKGDYEYSYILPGNSYICDAYTSSDAWFTVNRETDSVVEILWKKRVDPVTQNLSNNELIEIAENHLSAYIDRDTYIIEDVTTDEEGPFHLHLRKKIGDTLTTASAGISLRRNGEVMSLSLNMIEEIQALDNTMTQEEKEQLIAKFRGKLK